MAMKKEEFLDLVYKKCKNANDKEIRDVYDGMMKAIEQAVLDGEEVTLQGICTISAGYKPDRVGRNPRTGEELKIAEHMSPKAKMLGSFRNKVREMKVIAPAKKSGGRDNKSEDRGRDSGRSSGRRR